MADVDEAFEVWWDRYPNKTNKVAARRAWHFVIAQVHESLRPAQPAALIDALDVLIEWEYVKRATQMIPSPVNWLRDQRWNDADQYRERDKAFDSEEALNRGD